MKITLNGRPVWVNYHHLYCFWTVVAEGSLSKASKKLGIGQSALSIQMKHFEQTLGHPLFERSHRKMVVNEQGRLVFSYAQEIFRLGGEMVEALADQPTARRTHLKIGALDTIPKHLTVLLVQQALSTKDCSVSVVEGPPERLLEELKAHRVDLVVTNFFPATDPGLIRVRRIAALPLCVVGSRRYLKLKEGFPRSLHRQAFVVPTVDSQVRHVFESFCAQKQIAPETLVEAQDVMVQKLLAVAGVGLSVIPELAVREFLKDKELFQIGMLSGMQEELFLVSAARKIENPVAAALMKNFRLL